MKKQTNTFRILIIATLHFTICLKSQVVDESISGLQIGPIGIWLHNESKIAPNWAFRSEIGYEAPLNSGLVGAIDYPVFVPVISIEPRWYYNSPKRQGNSQNYFHNSSNFATVAIRFYPEFGALSAHEITEIDGGIFLIPTWGIRRNISYRINYEMGIGLGVDVYELLTSENSTTDLNFNVHLRLGYKFGNKAFKPD